MIRDEGERRIRDEADQFQADPGIAFDFDGLYPTLADGILDRLVHNAHRIEMRRRFDA